MTDEAPSFQRLTAPSFQRLTAPQPLLVAHSILVGLTPFIPVPVVDGLVKLAIERRLISSIASYRSMPLERDALHALSGERGSALKGIVKKIVKYPFRTMLRKLFLALQINRAADEASSAYHRAYLVDRALARGLLFPRGNHTAAEVRDAIEAACKEVPVSPLRNALAGAFEASRAGLGLLARRLLGLAMERHGSPKESEVEAAVDEAAQSDVLGNALRALASVPGEHFAALERAFDDALRI